MFNFTSLGGLAANENTYKPEILFLQPMNKFLCFLFVWMIMFLQLSAQFTHPGRGMYVDKFFRTTINSSGATVVDQNFSILSIQAKEDELLQYARENHITYLILFDLYHVFGNTAYESALCDFIHKAKSQYCIEKIGVASSCASMFDNVASVSSTPPLNFSESRNTRLKDKLSIIEKEYRPGDSLFYLSEVTKLSVRTTTFNDICDAGLDVLVTEYEFWNGGTDDCTDQNLTKDQKYVNYQSMIDYMDLIRDNYNANHTNHQIYVETYLGYLNQNTAYSDQAIANWIDGENNNVRRVDRITLHYYSNDATMMYSRTSAGQNQSGYYQTRFLDFCQNTTKNQTIVHPIFSAENTSWGAGTDFLGPWFRQSVHNNIFTAEKTWYNDWFDDAVNYHPATVGDSALGNIIHPGGALWFTSSQMVGHLNTPVLFTSNSPLCVSQGQYGSLQFQYQGPMEQGLSYKFYLTLAGDSVPLCGTTDTIGWPPYNPHTQTSLDLNAALGNCLLSVGDYDAHLELSYLSNCDSCDSSCFIYVVPPVRVSVVNSGLIVSLTPDTVCAGELIYLQASTTDSGSTTYAWYDNNSLIPGAGNSTYSENRTLTGSHNYSCLITSSSPGCSANLSNVIPVIINTNTGASITALSHTGCTVQLLALPPGSTYLWHDGSTDSTFITSYSGTYTVAVTKNGCVSTASYNYKKVNIEKQQQSNACSGTHSGSITINLFYGISHYTLIWTGPVSGTLSGLSAGLHTINNLSSGNYTFTVVDASGCSATLVSTINVNPLPNAIASSNNPVCTGNLVNLSSTGGVTYFWIGPNGFSSNLQNPVISNSTVSDSGVYTVSVTNSSGCSNTASVLVTVSALRLFYADADGDGFGSAANTQFLCAPSGIYNSLNATDCDDYNASTYPGAPEICGNGIDDNCDGRIDEGCPDTLSLHLIIEGFYLGGGLMRATIDPVNYPTLCDSITVELHDLISPHNLAFSVKDTINTSGYGKFIFPALPDTTYYIAIRHRNSIQTWSRTTVSFINKFASYDFSNSLLKAFDNGVNPAMKELGNNTDAIYSGDVNQDGTIDILDMSIEDNDAGIFLYGYNPSDLDGNSATDIVDMSIIDNNVQLFLFFARPY